MNFYTTISDYLTAWDIVLFPIYLIIIYLIAFSIKTSRINKQPEYYYFVKGLSLKLFSVIGFISIYLFYYKGGDTTNYFKGAVALINLIVETPKIGYSILFNNLTSENFSGFTHKTGFPSWYMWKDERTFAVSRYSTLIVILSAKSFIITSLLTACFSYIGIWKLFQLFYSIYPNYVKSIAIAILFIPSFAFWGSGIMKDTYVVGATCWITSNFYYIFIKRRKLLVNTLFFLFNFLIIISLKPYIILSLVPGMLFWVYIAYINQIKNALLKTLLLPIMLILLSVSGVYIFSNISFLLGDYGNLESAIERAKITQEDLLREEQYGTNNYNLGEIDGSISGLLSKAPLAIFTTIYRPSLVEVGSPTMVLSVIENTVLLLLTVSILIQTRLKVLYNLFQKNPLLLYSVVFSLILAFGVGIATANFGALVRYKIPLIPFYFSTLFILNIKRKELANNRI